MVPEKKTSHSQSKKNTLLERLGIRTDYDLVFHFPMRYEDETKITSIADAPMRASALFEGIILSTEILFKPKRQLSIRIECTLSNLKATIRFLHFYPTQQKNLRTGHHIRFFGEARKSQWGVDFIHPRYTAGEHLHAPKETLTPIYRTTQRLSQAKLQQLIRTTLNSIDLSEVIPISFLQALKLPSLSSSLRVIHAPQAIDHPERLLDKTHPAIQRLSFDELVAQQLSLRQAYLKRQSQYAIACTDLKSASLIAKLIDSLPFKLTRSQEKVWETIMTDLEKKHPMQRLIHGDVGSGKTILAALAALKVIGSNCQAALMAPTELLADQLLQKITSWLSPLGIQVDCLTGKLTKKQNQQIKRALRAGDIHFIIGTHALIEDDVIFHRLGLVIVDEQHRFGVKQRLSLREKTAQAHHLSMSATPIPRSLALSYFADLDVSAIDELPPNRQPVTTKLVSALRKEEIIKKVGGHCSRNDQVYWVCPLIEESEKLLLETVKATYQQLKAALPHLSVCLIHGRMPPSERNAIMEDFKANKIAILVSTTVIEVGVDVPNASLMIIENAERFGLAQLHQLRGRVGRGPAASFCILLYGTALSATGKERLKIIKENNNGFDIANQDLLLRGPGEFIGHRQSGLPLLRIAQLDDEKLLEEAKKTAIELLQHYPLESKVHLERWFGDELNTLQGM